MQLMTFHDLIRNQTFNKKLFSLTFPITMQNLMLALVAAADALMLGRVGQQEMAAVSLATQIQFVQILFLAAIANGIAVLGAQYWGKKDTFVLNRIFGLSVQCAIVISLLFFAGCFFLPEKLMLAFTHDDDLIRIGADYLRIASWSYLITGISQCYLAIMRVSEHAARSAWISSGAVILNIGLNMVFIFGYLGAPAMGVRGAALATVCARIVELIWCIVSSHEKSFIALQLRTLIQFNKQLFLEFWKYTLPILGSFLLWGIGFTTYTALMGHMGEDAAAANAVAAVVRDLMCCFCNGVAGGAGILIGNELGAGYLKKGKIFGERIMIYSFIIGFANTLLILGSIPIVSLFCTKLSPQAFDYMIGMFLILSVYMIGRCVCTVVINGIFSAGGDTLFDVYSLIVCMWGIALPCAFAGYYLGWHVLLVYACTCLDEVGKVPWVIWHYKRYRWVKNITHD